MFNFLIRHEADISVKYHGNNKFIIRYVVSAFYKLIWYLCASSEHRLALKKIFHSILFFLFKTFTHHRTVINLFNKTFLECASPAFLST